ncbi:unnamed protein product [Paramecium primaurelia]|uniref:EF-hand domain-containing protein n=1 Tax=Paramecium primaurelia TaxID=5886 RepID=A0A8S1MH20_PARPR|nr:unnamed protein product [Paramecium primaurelia]
MFYSTEPEPFPIAVISLELEDQTEEIKIYEGDDIEEIVENFCQYKGLEQKYVKYLIDQINQQLKKEPSPRFGDSFGQNFRTQQPLQTNQSQQSEVCYTTQASSVEENSAQKSYEKWQQLMNKKTDLKQLLNMSQNTVQWTVPNTARSFNENKKITANERLYRDGLDIQKNKNEKAEMIKIQKLQQESKQATFKPLISPRSKLIAQQKKKVSKPENSINEDVFHAQQKSQEQNNKKLQNRTQVQTQKRKESPFQPNKQINTSRNRSQNRSVTPIYEKLFKQAQEVKKKKEEFANQEFQKIYTFKPQVNRPTTSVDPENQRILVQKLVQEHDDKRQRIEKKRHEIQMQNQPTFHPKITKDQTFIKVSKQRDYEDSQLAVDLQKIQSRLGSKNSFSSSETRIQSQQSEQTFFDNQIIKIFNFLDGDKDGYISKDNIDLHKIDIDTLEIIKDVLYYIDDNNIIADQNQFKKICYTNGLHVKFNKS